MTEPKVRLLLFSGYKWENLEQKNHIYLANQLLAGRRGTSFPGSLFFPPLSHSTGWKEERPWERGWQDSSWVIFSPVTPMVISIQFSHHNIISRQSGRNQGIDHQAQITMTSLKQFLTNFILRQGRKIWTLTLGLKWVIIYTFQRAINVC